MKVRSSSGKPVACLRAQTIARSSCVAFQGSLCGRLEWSWQSLAPRLRHLRMVSVLTLKRFASTPVGSDEAGNLLADSGGGAGLEMKGVHQILHQARGGRREPSKRQVYSSIAQRTRSRQRSATKQLGCVSA